MFFLFYKANLLYFWIVNKKSHYLQKTYKFNGIQFCVQNNNYTKYYTVKTTKYNILTFIYFIMKTYTILQLKLEINSCNGQGRQEINENKNINYNRSIEMTKKTMKMFQTCKFTKKKKSK